MMLTLRGLPPEMEIPEIRSYILKRFAVGRVLLDELTTEAGGTRRVTVVTISDADAATLRHALSGERIGAYTLRVEPYLVDSPITSLTNNTGCKSGVLGRESRRNYGGLSDFRRHRGQLHERKSSSLGKRTIDDDDPIGSKSKIMRNSSESNAGLDSGIGVIFERRRNNSSEGYSPHRGGLMGCKNADRSQGADAIGGYNELDKINLLGGCNAIREHSPRTYNNRRESGKVSPLEHAAQEIKVHQTTMVSYAAPGQKLQVYSNTQSSGPAIPMNRERDSGQRRLGLISRNVPPWLVKEMRIAVEGSRERSLSPVSEGARGSKRRRSPSPTFRGTQPTPGNQQRMPPLKPPPTPQLSLSHKEVFNNAMAKIKAQLAIAKPITPLNVRDTPRIPFPSNPLQRFNPPIRPTGTRPQCSKPIKHFEESTINSDHAKNNSLANPRPEGDQTVSQDASKSTEPGGPSQVALKVIAKPAKYETKNIKSQTIYSHYATTIFNYMVDSEKVKPKYRSKAISFEHTMRHLICKRLRELTSEDPFHKDLVSIYRKAYPTSTDEETMKSVTKQLSLPEVPMALKDVGGTSPQADRIGKVITTAAVTLASQTMFMRMLSYEEQKELNEQQMELLTTVRAIIRGRIERMLIRKGTRARSLDEILTGYRKEFPRTADTAFLLAVVNKRLNFADVQPDFAQEASEQAFEGSNQEESNTNIPVEKRKQVPPSTLKCWCASCAFEVAGRALHGCVLTRKQQKELTKEARDTFLLARAMVHEQMEKIVADNPGAVCSVQELRRLYRLLHPPEEDATLKERVDAKLKAATETKEGNSKAEKPGELEQPLRGWCKTCEWEIADEALYGRLMTKAQRDSLPEDAQEKLREVRLVLRSRMIKIIANNPGAVSTMKDLRRLYRESHPPEEYAALRECVMDKAASDAMQLDIVAARQARLSPKTLRGWRSTCAQHVADEVLYGRPPSKPQWGSLTEEAQERSRLIQAIVHVQLREIIAGTPGVISSIKDVRRLYREKHPPEEDAALRERVMGMEAAAVRELVNDMAPVQEHGAKVEHWKNQCKHRLAEVVLFGHALKYHQRNALSIDDNNKLQVAIELVQAQLKIVLAEEGGEMCRARDIRKLYRSHHPPAEDAALKELVTRMTSKPRPVASEGLTMATDGSGDNILNNPAAGDNKVICQRNDNAVVPNEGSAGDLSDIIDFITDENEHNDRNTDEIEDNDRTTNDEIGDNDRNTDKIEHNDRNTDEIEDNDLNTDEIEGNDRNNDEIEDNDRNTDEIEDNYLNTEEIEDNDRNSDEYEDNDRNTDEIEDNDWNTDEIEDYDWNFDEFEDYDWNFDKTEDNDRNTDEIEDNDRNNDEIEDNDRNADEIADNDRNTDEIEDNDLNTDEIEDNKRNNDETEDNDDRNTNEIEDNDWNDYEIEDNDRKTNKIEDNDRRTNEIENNDRNTDEIEDVDRNTHEIEDNDRNALVIEDNDRNTYESKDNDRNTDEIKDNDRNTNEIEDNDRNTHEIEDKDRNALEIEDNDLLLFIVYCLVIIHRVHCTRT